MRMAARRRRRWIAIGGATAAVAIGIWAAGRVGAPTGLSAPSPTNVAPHLTWSDDGAEPRTGGYDVAASTGPVRGQPGVRGRRS